MVNSDYSSLLQSMVLLYMVHFNTHVHSSLRFTPIKDPLKNTVQSSQRSAVRFTVHSTSLKRRTIAYFIDWGYVLNYVARLTAGPNRTTLVLAVGYYKNCKTTQIIGVLHSYIKQFLGNSSLSKKPSNCHYIVQLFMITRKPNEFEPDQTPKVNIWTPQDSQRQERRHHRSGEGGTWHAPPPFFKF